jgi:hypothetical protein
MMHRKLLLRLRPGERSMHQWLWGQAYYGVKEKHPI